MSQMKVERPETLLANGAMASKYRFVVITGDYTVGYAGAGAKAYGVNLDTADAAGRGILIAKDQNPKLEAGAAFAAGAYLKPDAAGRGVTAASTQPYSARALQAATALGDIVEVSIEHGVAP
jgi:hypothetical protein